MRVFVTLLLACLPFALAQDKARCSYGLDIILVVDTSDSNIPRDDTLGALKRGMSELVEIHDIGTGPLQTRFGMCVYGESVRADLRLTEDNRQNLESIKTLFGNSPFTGFQGVGGFNYLHLGVQCGLELAQESQPGRQQLMLLILVANDLSTAPISNRNVTLAKQQLYVSTIAVGNGFSDIATIEGYPSAPSAYTRISSFRNFVSDAERVTPRSFNSICPIDLTTTTTTTTTPPPPLGDPCDNCVIINGVGYASTDDCFSYYQCIRQDNNEWLEFRRMLAPGAYWSLPIVSGARPDQANCPQDPCAGQPNGTVVGGYSNCRVRITCMGGVSSFVECCPEGQGLSGDRCLVNPNCNDECNPVDTTPGTCYLAPDVEGNPARFMATSANFSLSMPCPDGTVYQNDICGCNHDGEVQSLDCLQHSEIDLQFGPGGQVIDISRNRYSITTENFSTRESSPGSGVYVGVFDGSTRVRISNANSDLSQQFTLRVVYRATQNVLNAAVFSDAECIGTTRTVSVVDNNNIAQAFIRTFSQQTVTVDSDPISGRKEFIMQFDGAQLMADTNGQMRSEAAGPLLLSRRSCDGFKLGLAKDLNGFIGEIEAFQLYKCLGEGPRDFVQ